MSLKSSASGSGVAVIWCIGMAIVGAMSASSPARATTVDTALEPGNVLVATEVENLVVDGVTYDVTFGVTPDFTFFGKEADAEAATTALDTVLTAANVEELYFSTPNPSHESNGFLIPVTSCTADCQDIFLYFGTFGDRTDNASPWTYAATFDVGIELGDVYAEFGPVTATPLPAALPLFATGLGAMGLFGWRRKRKNNPVSASA